MSDWVYLLLAAAVLVSLALYVYAAQGPKGRNVGPAGQVPDVPLSKIGQALVDRLDADLAGAGLAARRLVGVVFVALGSALNFSDGFFWAKAGLSSQTRTASGIGVAAIGMPLVAVGVQMLLARPSNARLRVPPVELERSGRVCSRIGWSILVFGAIALVYSFSRGGAAAFGLAFLLGGIGCGVLMAR